MEAIGQNGNTGEHYDIEEIEARIKNIVPSTHKYGVAGSNALKKDLKRLKDKRDNDLTIKY